MYNIYLGYIFDNNFFFKYYQNNSINNGLVMKIWMIGFYENIENM